VNLAPFYPYPAAGYAAWQVAGSAALLAGVTVAVVVARRRCPLGFVGWFWFLGMMVPVLGLINVSDHAMADRYMYLPAIGLDIALVWGLTRLTTRLHLGRFFVGACAMTVIGVLGALAYRQAYYWDDNVTLWRHALAATGSNSKAEGHLAFALAAEDRLDEAVPLYRRAIALHDEPQLHNNLGIALARMNKLDEAQVEFQLAIKGNSKFLDAWLNLGALFTLKNETRRAIDAFLEALRLDPAFAPAHLKLGQLLLKAEQLGDAIDHFRRAIQLDPGNVAAHLGLAAALAASGQNQQAADEYRRVLQNVPDNDTARQGLQQLLNSTGGPPRR
jgi:protein O-mannosyl-transferase